MLMDSIPVFVSLFFTFKSLLFVGKTHDEHQADAAHHRLLINIIAFF